VGFSSGVRLFLFLQFLLQESMQSSSVSLLPACLFGCIFDQSASPEKAEAFSWPLASGELVTFPEKSCPHPEARNSWGFQLVQKKVHAMSWQESYRHHMK